MKYMTRILTTLLLAGLFISFDTVDTKLKDGYYVSSHGHSTILYKIDGDKIEWYRDNEAKSWGLGKYKIVLTDSAIIVSLDKLKTSRPGHFEKKDFDYSIDISWDNDESQFIIKGYRHTGNFDMIDNLKERVKSSCKIRVERPSR